MSGATVSQVRPGSSRSSTGAVAALATVFGVAAICAAISAGTPPLDGVGKVASS